MLYVNSVGILEIVDSNIYVTVVYTVHGAN